MMDFFYGLAAMGHDPTTEMVGRRLPVVGTGDPLCFDSSYSGLMIRATGQQSRYSTGAFHAVVLGDVLHSDRGALDAAEAAQVLAEGGLSALLGSDGCYVAGLLNRKNGDFSLFSDPLGTRPVFYRHDSHRLAFASQAKFLATLCGVGQQIDRHSALQFLMNRYPVGYHSLFAGAIRLRPGQLLHFQPVNGTLEVECYWDLEFGTDIATMPEAVDCMHEAFLQSHTNVFGEIKVQGDSYRIFLTGGMDSRGILGYAQKLGCLPIEAETWGENEFVPDSDPVIARQMADAVGIPFRFRSVDAGAWPEYAGDWVWHGELITDNANSYATPLDYFDERSTNECRFAIIGDQMLGAGPLPANLNQAVDNIMHGALRMHGDPLASFLQPDSHQEMLTGFEASLQSQLERCPNSHPKDVQDYLYFHNYISRWILAPGNFKYPMIPVRRPLMSLAVVEIVRHLAPSLRVDKAAYIALLRREFPALMSFRPTARESGVRWSYHSRKNPRLRDELQRLMKLEKLESMVIGADLDLDATSRFLHDFFSQQPAHIQSGGRLRRRLYDARRVISCSPLLGGMASKVQPLVKRLAGIQQADAQRQRYQVVMRLALLSLFEEQFSDRVP